MFTGLISDVGTVERLAPRQGGARLVIRPGSMEVDALVLGESVACSGACLTVVERGGGVASFDAVPETLSRTTVGSWRPGTKVNLERALAVGDRLGGHIVAGHVDAVGEILQRVPEGLDHERLPEAGQALEQHVAAGEHGRDQVPHRLVLADDHRADLALQLLQPLPGVQKVTVIVPSRTVIVVHDADTISPSQIGKKLADLVP